MIRWRPWLCLLVFLSSTLASVGAGPVLCLHADGAAHLAAQPPGNCCHEAPEHPEPAESLPNPADDHPCEDIQLPTPFSIAVSKPNPATAGPVAIRLMPQLSATCDRQVARLGRSGLLLPAPALALLRSVVLRI